MSLDSEALRNAMRLWSTGVTIVTAQFQGRRHGMTVSSFTSVSLEPPLVSLSLAQASQTHELVLHAGAFGITILSSSQQEISERFAGRIPDSQDRFVGLETFSLESGAPLIEGGLAFLDCKVTASYPVGANTLIVGEVVAARSPTEGEPLLYFNRGYHRLREEDPNDGRESDPARKTNPA